MDTKKLRQKILDLAIRGKLVPQNPNDEPASVLLERIRAEKERLIAEGKIKRPKKSKSSSSESHYQNLPENWVEISIGDLARTITDFVASGSFSSLRENVKYYDTPNYAILVRTKDFQNDFQRGLVYTDKHGYEFLTNSNLYGGELILPNIGASIGKVFIVPYLERPMTLAPNSIMVKCWDDVTLKWLYYYFLSSIGQHALNDISSSTAQGKFNKTDFREIVVPLPSLYEQERIVKQIQFFDTLLKSVENDISTIHNTIIATKAKILEMAMQGKLVPQDPADEPAADMLRRINPKAKIITDNPHYPKLPDNWVLVKMADLSKLLSGRDLTKDDCNHDDNGIPYLIGASNIENGNLNFSRWTKNPQVISIENDILLSCKGSIGEIVINRYGEIHIARQFMAIRCGEAVLPDYLNLVLQAQLSAIRKKANGIIPGISRPVLLDLIIPLPPKAEQLRIVNQLDVFATKLKSIEKFLH